MGRGAQSSSDRVPLNLPLFENQVHNYNCDISLTYEFWILFIWDFYKKTNVSWSLLWVLKLT